jgi:hydrogenase-4 component E
LGIVEFVFLIVETLLFKAIIIPLILSGVIKRNNIIRSVEPYITNFSSVVIASLIFVFGFVISYWSINISEELQHLAFGISISTIMIGLFIIISRKKIITHIMGYMILENGIFLLTLSISNEMPLMVSLGILLDIFIAIYILVIFFARIKSTFEETHIDDLTNLKD